MDLVVSLFSARQWSIPAHINPSSPSVIIINPRLVGDSGPVIGMSLSCPERVRCETNFASVNPNPMKPSDVLTHASSVRSSANAVRIIASSVASSAPESSLMSFFISLSNATGNPEVNTLRQSPAVASLPAVVRRGRRSLGPCLQGGLELSAYPEGIYYISAHNRCVHHYGVSTS